MLHVNVSSCKSFLLKQLLHLDVWLMWSEQKVSAFHCQSLPTLDVFTCPLAAVSCGSTHLSHCFFWTSLCSCQYCLWLFLYLLPLLLSLKSRTEISVASVKSVERCRVIYTYLFTRAKKELTIAKNITNVFGNFDNKYSYTVGQLKYLCYYYVHCFI